jgi:hypothetical protein
MMPRRKVAEPEPAAPRCEVCGEECDRVTHRYPPSGLAVGLCCLNKTSAELAVAYGRRLRRIAER